MEIQVKVDKVLEPYRFSKKDGSPCARFSFVGVTLEQYSKAICFDVIGDDMKWQNMGVVVGGVYTVSFDLSSREYNGKWYTGVTAWRCVRMDVQTQAYPAASVASPIPSTPNVPNTGGSVNKTEHELPF